MEKSLFAYLAAWYSAIAKELTVMVNGKNENVPLTYLHKKMLKPKLSTDLRWGSTTVNKSVVSADIVAMDSELPLKSRPKIETASGEIPKVGMKYKLTEKQMSDFDIMVTKGMPLTEIVTEVFGQTKDAALGVYERNEFVFLQAASSGRALVESVDEDGNNTGLGIRVDFGIKDSHRYSATTPWSDPKAKIVDDIKGIIKKAQSERIGFTSVMMDDVTVGYICENEQIKNNFAFSGGIATVGANVPNLDDEQLISFFKRKFKLNLIVVDRTITTEKNGKEYVHTPWEAGMVTFLPSENVGRLVYGILAEDKRRNAAVMYEKVEYILLKKWHTNEPYSEFTSSQALCLPVIDNAASIFLLDSKVSNVEDEQTEDDAKFDYKGKEYTKQSVVDAIKIVNPTSTVTIASKDSTLVNIINKFNEEQIAVFESNITEAV